MKEKELFKLVEEKLHEYKNMPYKIKNLERKIEYEKANISGGVTGISYDSEKLSPSYNVTSSVENEVIRREEKLTKLELTKLKIEVDMKNIENAMRSLNQRELHLFDLYYGTNKEVNMDYVAIEMLMDRSTAYDIRASLVQKIIGILYPEYTYQELPLLKDLLKDNN